METVKCVKKATPPVRDYLREGLLALVPEYRGGYKATVITRCIMLSSGRANMNIKHNELVEELAKLTPDELNSVLASLEQRLIQENQMKIAREIVDKYRPALLELAE